MAFHIKDRATLKGTSLTEAVRDALVERLQPLQERFAALSRPGGAPADKAFFDDLSGNP